MNENKKTINPKKQLEMLKTSMDRQDNEAVRNTPKPQNNVAAASGNNDGFDVFDIEAARGLKADVNSSALKNKAGNNAVNNNAFEKKGTFAVNTAKNNAETANKTQSPVSQISSIIKNNESDLKKTPSGLNGREGIREPMTGIKPDMAKYDLAVRDSRNILAPVDPRIKKEKEHGKKKKKKKEKVRGSNPVAVLVKALIYVAFVLTISCVCAYFVIVVANDVFAFVKDDVQTEITISEYATLDEIAEELHEKGVIKYPKIFVLYTMIRGKDPGEYLSGVYTVSPMLNYDELLYTFIDKEASTLTEISITIPEGYTVDDIITLMVDKNGIGTREGFIDAIQNAEYDYWFVKELTDLDPDRKYRLEGYLYPDTYYFYKEWDETKVIKKMLDNFYNKFSLKYKQACEEAGMSVDDVINLASLIQMEAKYNVDYMKVSSVIHNRLNSTYFNGRLECDATIQYLLPERKEELTHEDTLIDHPYNSYKYEGLTPGPISNPTIKAITAALFPDETNYFYFVSDKRGNMLYATTLEEHKKNIEIALKSDTAEPDIPEAN